MRYISQRDVFGELSTLEGHDQALNLQQSPAWSVDNEINAIVAIDASKKRIDAVPVDGDNWDLQSAAGLDALECLGVKGLS